MAFYPCKWHLIGSMENDMNKYEEMALENKERALHGIGFPPSKIDGRLGLDPGTAHDTMCGVWRREKLARTRNA